MFKRIKSPIGEPMSPWLIYGGLNYTTEEIAQKDFAAHVARSDFYKSEYLNFVDWIEAQGVRLL